MTDDGSRGSSPTAPKADQAASPHDPVGQVFVSHASADTAIAEEVCAALERAGMRCWIAPRDVMPGALYADAIVRAISNAKVVVLLLSENAVASPHVGKEIERSTSKRRPIVALRIDAAPLTPAFEYFLSESQWIDAQGTGLATVLPRLIEALRQMLASPDAATASRNAENTANVPHSDPYRTDGSTERGDTQRADARAASRISRLLIAAIAILAVGLVYVLADKFWVRTRTGAISVPPPTASAITDNSIAVLPFTDMSEKKDQEYFSDGLSEELIDLLTKIPQLRVPARTSSFYFKNRPEDIPTIAKKLLVAHVLEGSVRKSGDRLRVTAQLIRADNGYHLWSETYDRKLDDIFKLQDEIATAVVGALKLKLLAAPVAVDHQTSNPEAYNQFLIGHHLLSAGDWALDRAAIEPLRKAVELDPGYAAAWAGLAEAIFVGAEGSGFNVAELVAERRRAEDVANKAIELGPDLAAGYVERGFIRAWGNWDFQGAGEDFKRALALEPENTEVIEQYASSVLMPLGRVDEATTLAEKVVKADPLNSRAWRRLGSLQYFRGDYDAAVPSLQRSLEIVPSQSNTAAFLSYTYLMLKQPALALSTAQRATVELFQHQASALAEHDLNHTKESQKWLDEIIAMDAIHGAYQIAQVYAWFGEKDQAFQWLNRAYLQHDGGLTLVKVDPLLRALRSDPRYHALLSKLKLQD
jgi:TolB-like protein/cytochrome c-type biogenesis protein CcmH/NrfG